MSSFYYICQFSLEGLNWRCKFTLHKKNALEKFGVRQLFVHIADNEKNDLNRSQIICKETDNKLLYYMLNSQYTWQHRICFPRHVWLCLGLFSILRFFSAVQKFSAHWLVIWWIYSMSNQTNNNLKKKSVWAQHWRKLIITRSVQLRRNTARENGEKKRLSRARKYAVIHWRKRHGMPNTIKPFEYLFWLIHYYRHEFSRLISANQIERTAF